MTAAALQPAAALVGPPDPELVRIRDLIYRVAGIFHPDNKLRFLLERCERRIKELRVQSLHEYLECLTATADRQSELVALLNEITIGETCFFRNQPQLDALREVVIPKIIAEKSSFHNRSLRIWSAGCSTGEEPYTLSMLMLEEREHRLKDCKVEIIATDLNEHSLVQAKEGIYGNYSTRHVNPYYRQKYFLPVPSNQLQLQSSVRNSVAFRRLNLSDDAQMAAMKDFDIIFCCNVLIYFDLASKKRVIRHFYDSLLAHGYLFLSHAESLYSVSNDFQLVHLPAATAYIKDSDVLARRRGL